MEKQPLFSSTLQSSGRGLSTFRGQRLDSTCIRGKILGSMLSYILLELPDCGRCQHMNAGDDPKCASSNASREKFGKAHG
uniref:Uncharacterized protein n=1 Tax=Anopheles atroparvus TaxID=41427 RepID=A0A182J4D5_ANOAO